MNGTRAWMLPLIAALALLGPQTVLADQAADSTDQTFDFFLQEAKVVSASRREQNKSDSPVAIEVITHDDIVASGATNIVDLLRFQVGVDVADGTSLEGNGAEVNIRGLPQEFAQSMQVRVDGRSVVSPTNAGVFWQSLPINLDDIDRIEIVRGPNAALYGANAGQGVINIITIKPTAGSTGATAHAQVGSDGSQWEHLALTLGDGPVLARVSVDNEVRPTDPQPNGNRSNDLDRLSSNNRVNARVDSTPWNGGDLELFTGHQEQTFAIPPLPAPASTLVTSGSYSGTYGMAKLSQALGDDSLEISLSGSQDERVYGPSDSLETELNIDGLYRLSLMDGKWLSTLGGSLDSANVNSAFLFNFGSVEPGGADDRENRSERAYLQEALILADWATLDLAGSFENSDTGGEQPAYQGALILKPFKDQSLRLSASHSPTMPSLQNVYGQVLFSQGNFGGDPIAVDMVLGKPIVPMEISSYEATWSSDLFDRHLLAEVTGYQMDVENQVEFQSSPPPIVGTFAPIANNQVAIFFPGAVYAFYQNGASIVLRGLETVLTYKPVAGTTVQVNHTYEDVQFTSSVGGPHDEFLYHTTPWNKVNLLGQTQLPWGFNAGANVGWVGGHYAEQASRGSSLWIDDQATVDLRLGYKPTKNLEIYGVGQNLDHAYRTEAADGTAQAQTWYAGLNLAFGAGK
jgi:iron complex outermembrane receptor protein